MILHTVASINPGIGGPAVSVVRTAVELQRSGTPASIACLDYTEHGKLPVLPDGMLHAIGINPLTRKLRGWSPSLQSSIKNLSGNASLIHNHGIWMFPNHYAAMTARETGKPLVTSPRGMLGTWALSYHTWPKKVLWRFREKQDLETVAAFHATSGREAEDIRRAGFSQPIAVIPNGVDLPLSPAPSTLFPQLKEKRLALFMSRIHPKKGLEELINAWTSLSPALRDEWVLLIAGPDLTNHLPEVEKQIRTKGMEKYIVTHPPVSGLLKQALLEQAELFVLPSHEENFGIVVAEALAHGTPVITTRGTPWESLVENQCGWWIPLSTRSLAETLMQALSLSPQTLSAMGDAGRVYSRKELSWSAIASKMSSFYNWILNGGVKTDFIRTD